MSHTPLATAFMSAEDSPGFLLWQLSNKWQAAQRAALKDYDLTHVQFVLLATLTYGAGETVFTQKRLAEYTQVDVMMTSQVVQKLESKGLVQRITNKADRRALFVVPTPTGRELAKRVVRVVEKIDQTYFRVLGAEQGDFVAMMRRLIQQ